MKELIKIEKTYISGNEANTVDARELHDFLMVDTKFTDWFERRISEYGFLINSDFCSFLSKSEGGRPSTNYYISLDMAKELSMVERNERGKMARKYFIECEKKARGQLVIPQNFAEALQLAADQARQLEEQKPKVEFVDNYVDATGLFTITATAKKLKIKRKDLIECLIRDKAIFRRQKRLEPFADKVSRGFFEIKSGEKGGFGFDQTYVTAKGVQWIAENYMSEIA